MISDHQQTTSSLRWMRLAALLVLDKGTGKFSRSTLSSTDLFPVSRVPLRLVALRTLDRLHGEGRIPCQVVDELDGAWITAVKIIENQHQCALAGQFPEDSRQRLMKLDPSTPARQGLTLLASLHFRLEFGKHANQHMRVSAPQAARLAMLDDEILDQSKDRQERDPLTLVAIDLTTEDGTDILRGNLQCRFDEVRLADAADSTDECQ